MAAHSTIGLITPVKAAVAQWMLGFHAQAYPDTPANAEWCARDPKISCVWAAASMVDEAEKMLASWQKNANRAPQVSTAALLPVVFFAMATEYTETPTDQGRMTGATSEVILPFDAEHRIFHLQTAPADFRLQVAVAASEQASALSLIAQLAAYAVHTYRATAVYPFPYLGANFPWPVRIVPGERMSIGTPVGEQVKIMAMDLTVRVALPMLRAPGAADEKDAAVPPGYAHIVNVDRRFAMLGQPTGVQPAEWSLYLDRIADRPTIELFPTTQQRLPLWNRPHFK